MQFEDLSDSRNLSAPVTGSFLSAPREARDVTFAWSADTVGQGWGINSEWGGLRMYETMRRARPDFFIHTGDTIYADSPVPPEIRLPDGTMWKNLVTPAKSKVAETLDEFRGNYTYNMLDEHVRRFNAEIPQIVLWDDHEVKNNWYPGMSLEADERYTEKSSRVLVANARRAFLEHSPIRLSNAAVPPIYRSCSYGPLLDVFAIDLRTYRGPNTANRQPSPNAETVHAGAQQLAWLKQALRSSRATWKVIASDLPIGLVVRDGATAFEAIANGDAGVPLGRELEIADLLRFMRQQRIRNVIWVTGDVHYAAAHHYDPQRAQFKEFDRLTAQLQERVADALGCPGDTVRQRVEALMGAYFRQARTIARELARAQRAARLPVDTTPPTPVGRHFEIAADGIRFADPAAAGTRPSLWPEIFRLALAEGCPVSEQALDCIEQHLAQYTADDFAGTEAERQQIRTLFYPRPGLYARLSEMHDCGLLNTILPEFTGVHCRVIRDFHHKYTVDEHTLLTIRGLETLWNPPTPGRKRFGALLEELRSPEVLTLALLFHDIGKAADADHAQESVRMARTALDRLEIPADARQTIEFLVRNHLAMSQVAFRRDLDDPHVVAQFAHLVGTEELLKQLCLMTLVDVEAVSSTTLTPWKEELLWRLYVETYNHLTLGYGDELVPQDPAGLAVVIAGRPDDISESELPGFSPGCLGATWPSSGWRRSTATCVSRAGSGATRSTRFSRITTRCGS